jgi:hypothetical protein
MIMGGVMDLRRWAVVAAAVVFAVSASGCTQDEALPSNVSNKPLRAKDFDRSPTPKTGQRKERFHRKADATEVNTWFPLVPGLQVVKDGHVNVGDRRLTHRIVYTITDATKMINGVRATAVLDQDFNGGELAEQALDFVAQDEKGNVWYLGSYTEAYEGGQFVNATDAWLANVNGAKAGILMPAHPKKGHSFLQATVPGEGPAVAQVVKTGARQCVPFKCYSDVVVLQEGPTGGGEYKYLAPGVGGIKTEPNYSGGEQEVEVLVNVRELSPRGIAEISAEAIRLDRHAREVAATVFARMPPAKRTR